MSFCRCRRRAKFCGTGVNRNGKSVSTEQGQSQRAESFVYSFCCRYVLEMFANQDSVTRWFELIDKFGDSSLKNALILTHELPKIRTEGLHDLS